MPAVKFATEQEFQEFEKLLEQGIEPYTAARRVGEHLTCGAFRRGDRERYEQLLKMSKEARGHYVDKRIEQLAESSDPSPQIVSLWAKRWNHAYRETQQIEISGRDGGPIAVEGRAVVGLADVAAVARKLGYGHLLEPADGGDPERALPAASEVRPDPS